MASAKLTALADLASGQVPTDLTYIVDVSAGAAGSKKSTLNDFLAEITKNITDLTVQFANGAAGTVSAAGKGKLRYDNTAVSAAGSFQVSEAGAAYQNLIKGPASAGVLTANLLPFATAGDVIGDTALAQLGSTTSRTLNFNPFTPGTSLSSYSAIRVGVFDSGGFQTLGLLGLSPTIIGIYFGGTLASPTAAAINNQLFSLSMSGQYNTTPGNISAGGSIQVYATETWSASLAGAGMVFRTALNGSAPGNQIATLAINQLGCVHVRPSLSSGAISSTGTATIFQVGGNGATIDNLAVSFFCDIGNSGLATVKTMVLQRKAAQSGALLETQSASGVGQFSIVPQAGVENHFIDWVGSANTPAVSAAGSARLYINSSGVLQISQNGNAYSALATAPGGSTKQLQFNSAGSFGGAAGFEYQSGASPNVSLTAQNINYTALRVIGAGFGTENLVHIKEASATGTPAPFNIPGLLALHSAAEGFWNLVYATDGAPNIIANYLDGSNGYLYFSTVDVGDDTIGGDFAITDNGGLLIEPYSGSLTGVLAGLAARSGQSVDLLQATKGGSTAAGTYAGISADLYLLDVGIKRVSTQFDKTNTTLADVTGLSVNVAAGRSYSFEATLFVDASAAGGSKFAIAGTATATAIIYEIVLLDNSTNANTITARQTGLAGASAQSGTTAGLCRIKGLITVNAAGTLTVQFAQNVASGTSSILVGSDFIVRDNP